MIFVSNRCLVLLLLTVVSVVFYSILIYINNKEDGEICRNLVHEMQSTHSNVFTAHGENETQSTKYILYWTKMFSREDFYYGLGYKPFEKCEYNNCFTTRNKSLIDLTNFSALLFHGPLYDINKYGKPWKRSNNQRYVFVNLETPNSLPKNLDYTNHFYNWTMTYRKDSDIPNPYGYYVKSKINFTAPTRDQLKSKKSLIAWFVSHCNVSSKRAELVKRIMKYTTVDIYGRCGTLSCSREKGHCYTLLEKNYKFYLSFENSYCKDYVTEKFFNILNVSVVPVVYGRANYKDIAPPHSFINVEDFSSVIELVNYLKYLDTNDDAYLEYFKWKTDYYVVSSFKYFMCDLCKKLNTNFTSKTYPDIEKWWKGEKDATMCYNNEALPQIVLENSNENIST